MNQEKPLPPGWVRKSLGEIVDPVVKVQPKDNSEAEFTYLDISSIDNTRQKIVNPKRYFGKDAPSRARQLVCAGDILFSTVRTYLKNIAAVPPEYDGQIASTGFCVIRPSKYLNKRFCFYLTLTDDFINPLSEIQRGTSYPAVRNSDVLEQIIPSLPSPNNTASSPKSRNSSPNWTPGSRSWSRPKRGSNSTASPCSKPPSKANSPASEWREGRLAQVRVKHLPDEATSKPGADDVRVKHLPDEATGKPGADVRVKHLPDEATGKLSADVRVKHLPNEATGKLGADGQMLHPNEDASQLLQRILAERRAKWEAAQWAKEIERAQKKAAQAKRRAEGKPARIRDLQPEEWGAIIEAEYARYLPKNDKWKMKYKEPDAPDTEGLPGLPEGWVWGNLQQLSWNASYGTSQKCTYEAEGPP
ncbi:MAG: restriction endonuclease subunit S, partial [Gammaproteobacteria bacterium]|nr:restriction endonuclease subunit S [Gammaproteobacteria bacterium]